MRPERIAQIKKILEETHDSFVQSNQLANDALAPALKFKNTQDLEFASFICAILAYGKVAHIQSSVRKVLDPLGERPVQMLLRLSAVDLQKTYESWAHRFNTASDMVLLLLLLKQVYLQHETLEAFLKPQDSEAVEDLLERMIDRFSCLSPEPLKKFPKKGESFWFFLPRPSSGSACKRLNLFLRWMVGTSEMDLGLWKSYPKSRLLIPVDTHVLKQARSLRFTKRKTADWVTAVEITEKLRLLDAADPTRFDFALCHLGIKGSVLK